MAVAQLVESRIVIPVVVGSSPISHPSISAPVFMRLPSPRGVMVWGNDLARSSDLTQRLLATLQARRLLLLQPHCSDSMLGLEP